MAAARPGNVPVAPAQFLARQDCLPQHRKAENQCAALDKPQAFRKRLGKPLIVGSI